MGQKYTAKLPLAVRKLHTCFRCGARFSYVLKREISAEHAKAEQAHADAVTKLGVQRLAEVDIHPCPACGFIQPEMISKEKGLTFMAGAFVGVVGLVIALAVGWLTSITVSAWIAAVVVALTLWIYLHSAYSNPNQDLNNNLDRTAKVAPEKELRVDTPGAASLEFKDLPSCVGLLQIFALAVMLLGVIVAVAPAVLPLALGWSQNSGWTPSIIGPGDRPTYRFGELTSLKGLWTGQATASATGEGLAESLSLPAETKTDTWGDRIGGKRVSNQTHPMWVQVQFPQDRKLARKTLKLHVTSNVRFPLEMGGGFDEQQHLYEDDTTVTLADPGVGTLWYRLWWVGQLGVLIWTIVAGVLLDMGTGNLKSAALPHEVEDLPTAAE